MKPLLFSLLFLPLISLSQKIDRKEINGLYDLVSFQIFEQENPSLADRKSEFIIGIFELDSLGAVQNVHFLGDSANKDSTYSYLTKFAVSKLKDWKNVNLKNKKITIPILSINPSDTTSYASSFHAFFAVGDYKNATLKGDVIIGPLLHYQVPYSYSHTVETVIFPKQ